MNPYQERYEAYQAQKQRDFQANPYGLNSFYERQAATSALAHGVLRAQVGGAVAGALIGNALSGGRANPPAYGFQGEDAVDAACARAEARAAQRASGAPTRSYRSEAKVVLSYFGAAVATVLSLLALAWVGASPDAGAAVLVLVIHLVARWALPSLYIWVAYVFGFIWAVSALSALVTSD